MFEKLVACGINIVLTIITAFLMVCSYYYLIDSIEIQRTSIQSNKLKLENEINSLNQMLSHPKDLTMQEIINFDAKNKTNFSSLAQSGSLPSNMANQEILTKLEQQKIYKEATLSTINQIGILEYLPPWRMLIILSLGAYFTGLINNFSNTTYSSIPKGVKKIINWLNKR